MTTILFVKLNLILNFWRPNPCMTTLLIWCYDLGKIGISEMNKLNIVCLLRVDRQRKECLENTIWSDSCRKVGNVEEDVAKSSKSKTLFRSHQDLEKQTMRGDFWILMKLRVCVKIDLYGGPSSLPTGVGKRQWLVIHTM